MNIQAAAETEPFAFIKMSAPSSASPHQSSRSKMEFPASFLGKFNQELNNPDNFFVPWLEKLEERTKVKRIYLVYGFLFFLAIYLILGYAAELICNAIAFLYPAYQSLKALESSSKEDDTKWLMYWVVFASFSLVEFFSDCLLDWFPPYFLAKLIFLVWLSLPIQNNGATIMYHKLIRPVFLRNQGQIADAVGSAISSVTGSVDNAYKDLKKMANKDK